MIVEFDKKYLRELYDGNLAKMRAASDYIEWTPERIQKCFAFGHGTEKDFREYMQNNRKYCLFFAE